MEILEVERSLPLGNIFVAACAEYIPWTCGRVLKHAMLFFLHWRRAPDDKTAAMLCNFVTGRILLKAMLAKKHVAVDRVLFAIAVDPRLELQQPRGRR